MNSADLVCYPDVETMSQAAAQHFGALAQQYRPFTVALAGGNTPKSVYHILGRPPYRDQIDWVNVFLFWGDERCVPPDDENSNFRMAQETLIEHVPIPERNVFRIQGELEPKQAASMYQKQLYNVLERKRFDLILLGMGSDGHTASLFPGTEAVMESSQWVTPNYVPKLSTWRVTLTLPVINRARHVLFLVSGDNKADALSRILAGEALPAGLVKPSPGTLQWFVDQAAYS